MEEHGGWPLATATSARQCAGVVGVTHCQYDRLYTLEGVRLPCLFGAHSGVQYGRPF